MLLINPESTPAPALQRLTRTARLMTLAAALQGTAHAASVAPVAAPHGMVVTAQHLATQVGVDVLKAGGNATDAAVAVAYALSVVYPSAGGLMGGGFMLLHSAQGDTRFIDFRETAPQAAQRDMFLGADGQPVKGRSTRSPLAVAVPGLVAGLELALQAQGSRPRAALMAPAIRLAEQGFALTEGDAAMLAIAAPDLLKDPPSAALFTPGGRPLQAGQRLVQRDLAQVLRRVARQGAAGFYTGPTAQAIARHQAATGGLLSTADLAGYRALQREPVRCAYRGLQVVTAAPPSGGGVALCQMLQVLEAYPLKDWGWRSAQGVHVQIEAMRHAFVDRNHLLGDPAFVANPVARLTSPAYAAEVRAAITPGRAGTPETVRPGVAPHATWQEGTNTTHFSVVDRWGNAASVTTTLNDWYGARLTVPGTGLVLNNGMDDFSAKPGAPNLYGLAQGEANAIAPGKRPLSSMTPTVVLKDGQVWLVLGTPGGSRIITSVLHTLLNVVDHGMDIQEAVDAPRFHQQWLPAATNLEPFALSPDTQALLRGWGHSFSDAQPANHLAAILVGAPKLNGPAVPGQRLFGANDPRRRTGLAAGH
jgi:gamma-glutamyltranspeptidase/glutathione hydrolase